MRWSLLLLALVACSDRDAPPADAGRDAATADAAGDAGRDAAGDAARDAELDSGEPDSGEDAGDTLDAADAELDAADVGTDTGDDAGVDCVIFTVGDPCTEGSEECGSDGRYECDLDFRRCVPAAGRPICGGFAGAPCPPTGTFTECLLNAGASGGPCLRPEEVACACPAHDDFYDCPE